MSKTNILFKCVKYASREDMCVSYTEYYQQLYETMNAVTKLLKMAT